MIPSPKVAVLLAAGRGKRLRPHTDHTPKPLLPINGRPTLDFVLEAVIKAGIERVCLVTHHLEEQIHDYIGDGSRWGLLIHWSDEQPEAHRDLDPVRSEWVVEVEGTVVARATIPFVRGEPLADLPRLFRLYLEGVELDADVLEHFASANPRCEIFDTPK